jgi:hypothetical protein
MKKLIVFALIMMVLSGLFSCKTEKNFNGYIAKVYAKVDSPRIGRIAEKCALLFPVVESDSSKLVYLPGKPYAVPGETQYINADCSDAVKAALDDAAKGIVNKAPVIIKVRVPVYKQVDTAELIKTITKKSTADIVAAQGRNNALQQQNNAIVGDLKVMTADKDKYKSEKKSWEYRALWTWGILAALLIIRLCWSYIKSKV